MTRDPTCSSARLSLQNYGLLSGFRSKPSGDTLLSLFSRAPGQRVRTGAFDPGLLSLQGELEDSWLIFVRV